MLNARLVCDATQEELKSSFDDLLGAQIHATAARQSNVT